MSTSKSERTHRHWLMRRNPAAKQQMPYPITQIANNLVKRNSRHSATDSTDEAPLAKATIMQTAQKKSLYEREAAREQAAENEPIQEDYHHVECNTEHRIGVSCALELHREFRNELIHEYTINIYRIRKEGERDEEIAPPALDIMQTPIGSTDKRIGDATCHIVEKSEGHDSSFIKRQHYRRFSTQS